MKYRSFLGLKVNEGHLQVCDLLVAMAVLALYVGMAGSKCTFSQAKILVWQLNLLSSIKNAQRLKDLLASCAYSVNALVATHCKLFSLQNHSLRLGVYQQ